jgi:hypothetical protein
MGMRTHRPEGFLEKLVVPHKPSGRFPHFLRRYPKRIVENVFISCNDKYRDTIDAPIILGSAHYQDIANACPQNFKPFIDFLESLFESRTL